MDREALATMYLDFLADEGYRPRLDEDGDVVFKREGKTYLIFLDEADTQFFRMVFPNFWPIESEAERQMVLAAADAATAHTKTAKVYTVKDNVWVSVELFLEHPQHFKAVFSRCMDALGVGVQAFTSSMKRRTAE